MRVEWDEEKNRSNIRKHGISFQEAADILKPGRRYQLYFDEDHSEIEDRYLAFGVGAKGMLTVCCTEPEDDLIRIISARKTTRAEMIKYNLCRGELQ